MSPTSLRSLLFSAAMLPCLPAQTWFVAPAGFGYETKGGESQDFAPFSGFAGRSQQLFAFPALGFAGGTIQSIAFRRDATANHYSPNRENVVVRLGYSDHLPVGMPASFELTANGALQQFHSGPIDLPDAPPGNAPHPWSVLIPGQTPFAFAASSANGRSLLLEVESSAPSQNTWGRDARRIAGDAQLPFYAPRGIGCLGSNGRPVSVLLYPRQTGVPGRVMSLLSQNWAPQVKSVVALLGVVTAPPYPIDLTPLGMTGCKLHTDPLLLQTVPAVPGPGGANDAVSHWPIPPWPILAGLRVVSQYYALDLGANAASVITSGAIDVHLGTPGARAYTTQSIWSVPGNTVPSQFPDEFGAIVRFGGALQ